MTSTTPNDARVAKPPRIAGASGRGLVVSAMGEISVLSWADVNRVVVSVQQGFVGDTMLMLVELNDTRVVVMSEGEEAWGPVIEAIATHLHAMPREQWVLRLIGRVDDHITIYERTATA